jgi:predicted transcriptional regulator
MGPAERRCVADIMQRKVVAVQADDTLVDAGNLMIVTKLWSVPVPTGAMLAGGVSD